MAMISTQTMGDTEERSRVQQLQTKIVTCSVVAPSKQPEKHRRYLGRITTCHLQVASFQERYDNVFWLAPGEPPVEKHAQQMLPGGRGCEPLL